MAAYYLHKEKENPLYFITLTNLHKFVIVNREHRAGNLDKKFLKKEIEDEILLCEIEALNPNLVFLSR